MHYDLSALNFINHEIITGVHALDYATAYRATYLENMIDSIIQPTTIKHKNKMTFLIVSFIA
jgi:hypothetical protein